MTAPGPEGEICVVVNGWPRLSTTFIAQELIGLERLGLRLRLVTFGKPDDIRHEFFDTLQAPVVRLPAKPHYSFRYLAALAKIRGRAGFRKARAQFRSDVRGSARPKQLRKSFRRACILAAEIPAETRLIYVHFINFASDIARYAATIAGLPLAGSAHARDIWVSGEEELRTRLAQMRWCTTCTELAATRLGELSEPNKIHLVHHGLLFDRFPADPPARPSSDGSDPARPVQLLSVGRAVEKKGFDLLLEALASLPPDLHWRWNHVGGGELVPALQEQAEKLGIADRVLWHGPQTQAEVIAAYRGNDLFILPARLGSDGDRDGLPNVLMEAQSQALPCISTDFSGIPELIHGGETGVLVPPGDVAELASAIERAVRHPAERARLGQAGHDRVRSAFDAWSGFERIAELLRGTTAT